MSIPELTDRAMAMLKKLANGVYSRLELSIDCEEFAEKVARECFDLLIDPCTIVNVMKEYSLDYTQYLEGYKRFFTSEITRIFSEEHVIVEGDLFEIVEQCIEEGIMLIFEELHKHNIARKYLAKKPLEDALDIICKKLATEFLESPSSDNEQASDEESDDRVPKAEGWCLNLYREYRDILLNSVSYYMSYVEVILRDCVPVIVVSVLIECVVRTEFITHQHLYREVV